jgi:hypothetical protein
VIGTLRPTYVGKFILPTVFCDSETNVSRVRVISNEPLVGMAANGTRIAWKIRLEARERNGGDFAFLTDGPVCTLARSELQEGEFGKCGARNGTR